MNSKEDIKTCYLGKGSYFWKSFGGASSNQTANWETTSTGCSKEVSVCYVSDLLESDETAEAFKFPNLVEEIHVDGMISHINFEKLIKPLRNLKLLEIHISSLQNLYLEKKITLPHYLYFEHLESLSISSYGLADETPDELKIDRVVLNFSLLLRMTYPNLSFLAVSIPLVRHREHEMIEAILKCLKIHQRTLKSLNLECSFEISTLPSHTLTTSNLTEFLRCEIEVSDLKDVQLHSFHFLSTYKTEGTRIWRTFLHNQKKLEYLQFWCKEKFYPLPTLLIHHNFRTIHTLALNIDPMLGTHRNSIKTEIDCSTFQKCSLLRTLVLRGKPRDMKDPNIPPDVNHFTNFNALPKGLRSLRLSHLNLTTRDAGTIAREMPNLAHLYLENVGETGNFGMALKDLAHILGKKDTTMKSIDIHDGINIQSLDDIKTKKPSGYAILVKLIFKANRPRSFRVVRSDTGEFDVVNEALSNDVALIEDEILHEDFGGNVSEDSIIKDDENHGEQDITKSEKSHSLMNTVQWLTDAECNQCIQMKNESGSADEALCSRRSVCPIQLNRKSVSKYLRIRQKALKAPGTPTIHELLSETSDLNVSKLESDEDEEFLLSKVSSSNIVNDASNEENNKPTTTTAEVSKSPEIPNFKDAETSMDYGPSRFNV